MSSEYREIILRNDNPNITYVGNWMPIEASIFDNLGNFGPAYSPTLHSAKLNSSSMSVFGTVNSITNESSKPNPTWQCSIDSISLGEPNVFPFPENNWALCNVNNIPDGAHELVVNVTSDGMSFYLDYIRYRSSSGVSLENSLIYIDNPDPAIDYISGWSSLGETANMTADPTSLVTVTFVGAQLSWYGFIPIEESHNASSGEYSVDGEPFTPFQLAGLPQTATATAYNQLFFITPILETRTHILSVKYTGLPDETPLTLDYLIVTNGSFPSSSTNINETGTHTSSLKQTSSSIQVSSSTGSPATAKNSSTVQIGVGKIVGPIVGVVVIVAIIFIWFKFNRKRRQRYTTNNVTPNLRQPIPDVPPSPSKISQLPEDPNRYAQLPNIMSPVNVVPTNPFNDPTSPCTTSLRNPSHTPHASQPNATRFSNLNPIIPTSLFTTSPQSSSLAVAVVSADSSRHPLSASAHPGIHIRHEDSGIRLPQITPSVIDEIEIFPTYTKQ